MLIRKSIYFLFLIFSQGLVGQNSPLRFEKINRAQGLSQNTVNQILQDHLGFLWLATENGLNRYDGYGFKVYRHDPLMPNSLSSNFVTRLFEDRDHRLWVVTSRGLNRFDRQRENTLRKP